MSRLRFGAAASLLALAAVLLWLNLREKDYYEGGSLAPPPGNVPADDGILRRIVPETLSHPCPAGGDCIHPLEIPANRRVLSLRDRDGWYRLFWAGDEIYYYEDPALFAACLRNSTARDPSGTWKIRIRPGRPPAAGPGNPACALEPAEFEMEYRLEVSPDPPPPGADEGPLPRAVEWFSFFPARRHLPYLLRFRWRLESPAAPPALRCSCERK